MENNIAIIGVIEYKQYSENVIIDNNFDIEALYKIMDEDKDFISFHIQDTKIYIYGTVTVTKDVDILGTTYNAFAKNPYTHKTKTTWNLSSGGYMLKKKDAEAKANKENEKNRKALQRAKLGLTSLLACM